MLHQSENGIQSLQFELFDPFPRLKHAVLLRHGGVSVGKYATLNLSAAVGDDPSAVEENQRRVSNMLGCGSLISAKQVHGKTLLEVNDPTTKDMGAADGLMTKKADLPLMIHHADCQAAIFYDPVEHALAVVHSGWRGSVQNIYKETIDSMRSRYGTKVENLHVAISPSLGPEHAEFVHYKQELPENFWDYQLKPFYFDFWAISEMQLKEEGVRKEHIQIARICTYAGHGDYYSYRRDKIRGGHGTVALLL